MTKIITPGFKKCAICGELKPLDDFYKNKLGHQGCDSRCKPCKNRQRVEYDRAYPEQKRRANKLYKERHPEDGKRRDHERYYKDLDFTRLKQHENYIKHRDKRLAWVANYQRTHKNVVRASSNNRRARKRNAQGHFTSQQLADRIAMFGGKCYVCGKPYEEVDHVIPLSKGGTNWPANLRPICKSCNCSKSNKDWKLYT